MFPKLTSRMMSAKQIAPTHRSALVNMPHTPTIGSEASGRDRASARQLRSSPQPSSRSSSRTVDRRHLDARSSGAITVPPWSFRYSDVIV